jgi:hypothetical protein
MLGPVWFIGIFGVFVWGFSMAVIMTLYYFFAYDSLGNPGAMNWQDILIRHFTSYPFGGLIFGTFLWFFGEWSYKKTLESRTKS